MRRIICRRCKKRRIPWWSKWVGDKLEEYWSFDNARVKITISPDYNICAKCVDNMFSRLGKNIKESIQ